MPLIKTLLHSLAKLAFAKSRRAAVYGALRRIVPYMRTLYKVLAPVEVCSSFEACTAINRFILLNLLLLLLCLCHKIMSESVPVLESFEVATIKDSTNPKVLQIEHLTCVKRLVCFAKCHLSGLLLMLAPVLLSPLLYQEPAKEYRCAYVLCLMSILWITETIPLYVTSLLPIILFPIMGILDSEYVCKSYFSNSLVLFFGSLVVALAIEYCNLHKRVALCVILLVGCSPRKLHLSLMLVTMFISMWLSNSAATSMMCPVIAAILKELSDQHMLVLSTPYDKDNGEIGSSPSKVVVSYYLGVAFAASIGGCATLIGTGTNICFKGILDTRFKDSQDINFITFAMFSLPTMIICLLLVYVWLQWLHFGLFRPKSAEAKLIQCSIEHEELTCEVLRKRKQELGPITQHELQVAALFLLMIVCFLTRNPGVFPGWADYFQDNVKNSVPVIGVVIILFVLPVHYNFLKYFYKSPAIDEEPDGEIATLLNWQYVQAHNHWGLLLLTGGGIALAEGIKSSGFATLVGNSLSVLAAVPAPLLQFICICMALVLTALSSNIAMCNVMIPILMEIALSRRLHPLYLTLPASMTLSMAFLFPISTPPNAIVAAWAHISNKDMFIAGIGPCAISVVVIFIASQSLAFFIYPEFGGFPSWAEAYVKH